MPRLPLYSSALGLAVGTAMVLAGSPAALAADRTVSVDIQRDGWDRAESGLHAAVARHTIASRFTTAVIGQVYAQPVIYDDSVTASNSRLIVATEADHLIGLDPNTGAVLWDQVLGTPEPEGIGLPTGINYCSDITPLNGVTSTPVIDAASHRVYTMYRTWDGVNSSSAAYYLDARDTVTGTEVAGWPTLIQGTAVNDAATTFSAPNQLQRAGLLLVRGSVYAGFGSICDINFYEGWIGQVNVTSRVVTLWTDVPGHSGDVMPPQAGVWQAGGGIASDGAGHLFFETGNGVYPTSPTPVPGSQAATVPLSDAVVRLDVSGRAMTAGDFFTPWNTAFLSANDKDLGSSGATLLPDGFGGPVTGQNFPHLVVAGSKAGIVFLLNRDNLGGFSGSSATTDAGALAETPMPSSTGYPPQIFSHAAVWGGDGGYIYYTGQARTGPQAAYGTLTAMSVGADSSGRPTLTVVGTAPTAFGGRGLFSGSPAVTSSGSANGSGLVWVIAQPNSAIGETSAQLRAYEAVPVSGTLTARFAADIAATKFAVPATDQKHVYVGGGDPAGNGYVYGFA